MGDKKALGDLTFSILIEAENVARAGLKPLRDCLATLEAQDLSRAEAESRINSLTDDEINSLALDIDQYAGGQFDDSDDGKAIIGVLIGLAILICLAVCLIVLL